MIEILQLNRQDLRAELREIVAELVEEAKTAEQPSDRLLTATEVINTLKISLPTLWRWGKSGYLIPTYIGSKKMYREKDIKRIMEGEA